LENENPKELVQNLFKEVENLKVRVTGLEEDLKKQKSGQSGFRDLLQTILM